MSGSSTSHHPDDAAPGQDSPGHGGATPESGPGGAGSSPAEAVSGHLFRYLAVYTVLRLALVAVLTVALSFFMPLIVALLFAIIVQLPLAWLRFCGPRGRVNEAMAQASARRRAERARL